MKMASSNSILIGLDFVYSMNQSVHQILSKYQAVSEGKMREQNPDGQTYDKLNRILCHN